MTQEKENEESSRMEIMKALDKAIETFYNELNWNFAPAIRFEAREILDDGTFLGDSIVIDTIKQFKEVKK